MIFGFKPEKVRDDFEILKTGVIYFDSACMSLKPRQVVEKVNEYYHKYPGCAGRSAHRIADLVTHEVDEARAEIAKLVKANGRHEIVFTRNTTEGLNLVAHGLRLKDGDEVVISDKEHNSNLIPWLKLKKDIGIKLKIVKSNADNTLDIERLEKAIGPRTKLVSIVHRSNMDGVTNPAKEICKIAHKKGTLVMLDGAQSVPGMEIDVHDIGVDLLSFSGHKMLGPTGTGVLYGKKEILEKLDQFIVGGETVKNSTYEDFVIEDVPHRFEAGLQDYAGIVGLGEASRYLRKIGLSAVAKHEARLNKVISEGLATERKIELIGPVDPAQRSGIYSFNIHGMDPHHVSKMLDVSKKILTRSGAHCVHSWFNKRNMKGSARASLYLYNTEDEAQKLVEEVKKIAKMV
ncbi:MAG: cysteine desulfurase [Nanoarchaeota archaeon]